MRRPAETMLIATIKTLIHPPRLFAVFGFAVALGVAAALIVPPWGEDRADDFAEPAAALLKAARVWLPSALLGIRPSFK